MLCALSRSISRLPTIKSAMTMVEYQGTNVWNHKQQAVLQRYGRNVVLIYNNRALHVFGKQLRVVRLTEKNLLE